MDDKDIVKEEVIGMKEPNPEDDNSREKSMKDLRTKDIKEWAQAIITAVVLALIIRTFIFEIIQVDGRSMYPTLHDSDRVVVLKIAYRITKPAYGDIVIFKNPDDMRVNYVKRIIGLPGDSVSVSNGMVYRNGESIDEPYLNEPTYADYSERVVPEGTIFALGDNRNQSKDSRDSSVGFIPMKNLLGEAKLRVWPFKDITVLK